MIKNISICAPDDESLYQRTIYKANLVVTRIRREQFCLSSGHTIDKVYISFDLQLLLGESSIFRFAWSSNSDIIGFLWNLEVRYDYNLVGLQFHFNDLDSIRHLKINSILEDSKAELTIYQIEFVRCMDQVLLRQNLNITIYK